MKPHEITFKKLIHHFDSSLDATEESCQIWWKAFVSSEPAPADCVSAMRDFVAFVRQTDKVNPSTQDSNGLTPLHIAASKGYDLYLEKLCQTRQIDLNCTTAHSQSRPIHSAVIHHHLACLQVLKKHGANLNLIGENGATCLSTAANKGFADIVAFIVDECPEFTALNGTNNQGFTALQCAIASNKPACVTLLLPKLHQARGGNGNTIVHTAVDANNLAALEAMQSVLPTHINSTNRDNETPLVMAILRRRIEMVNALLERGAYLDSSYADHKPLVTVAALYFRRPMNEQVKKIFDVIFAHWKTLPGSANELAKQLDKLAPADKDPQKLEDFNAFKQSVLSNQATTSKGFLP